MIMKSIFVLALLLAAVSAQLGTTKPPCGKNQVRRWGPTWACDNTICRGAQPLCEDPNLQEHRCRCKKGFVYFNSACRKPPCPLYP